MCFVGEKNRRTTLKNEDIKSTALLKGVASNTSKVFKHQVKSSS